MASKALVLGVVMVAALLISSEVEARGPLGRFLQDHPDGRGGYNHVGTDGRSGYNHVGTDGRGGYNHVGTDGRGGYN
ncbi:hypothetical protein QJS10_CPB17g02033 [Acorus calamus]|uniref:Uncharacterized protein n=1 Tax=Acorus calamus TaxID=4465 RepID=A0AAV9CXF0_ACOCL|nr:hypothetical protein QJS10_CPB17g02033 [Acorus calamus]